MIAYLSGKIVLSKDSFLIVEANGVGYKVIADVRDKKTGAEVQLFVHHHIREDAEDLYGFNRYEELELFEKLISVNGVGPKVAMNIMAGQKDERITSAILHDDVSFFQAIPGIGKKVAAKIILDLKSKISGLEGNVIGRLDTNDEVVDAMASLGYKNSEIIKIIPKIPDDCLGSEEKIRWIIKNIKK